MLQARGSLQELIDDLNVCEDEAYVPTAEIPPLKELDWGVLRLLNGYLRWLRECKTTQSLTLRENSIPYGEADADDDLEEWLASLPV
jgi:hypothetical protein